MVDPPFEIEELKMAWRRVKWDLDHRVFTTHAFEKDLLDLGQDEWLGALCEELNAGRYTPQPCEIVEEVSFHIRPGARLEIKDQVVYAATAQRLYQATRDYLRVAKTTKDFAYLLRSADKVPWFQHPFSAWKGFQKVSLGRIAPNIESVLFADISGFYENIDLSRLRDMLRGIGVADDVLTLLLKCLRQWANPRGRGIPQGLSPSDLLAKAYLEAVDRQLERAGFDHIRYVDDYRVFCASRLQAKKALRKLIALLRQYGLNVGTPKTLILDPDDARSKIAGKIPNIEHLAQELFDAVRAAGFESPYLRVNELPQLEQAQAEVGRAVMEDAFREYFSRPVQDFNATLFHYLLNRLAKLHSDVAIEFCVRQLSDRPEETLYVLDYLGAFLDDHDVAEQVLSFAESAEATYEHQLFLIMRWLHESAVRSDGCLQFARRVADDRSQPFWLRSYALAVLGDFGDGADLDGIEGMYSRAANDLERATILCAIRRMPSDQRNAIYGRCRRQSLLNSLAADWAQRN
jgi:hypothetical protein